MNIQCPQCAAEIPQDSVFCQFCGTRLETQASEIFSFYGTDRKYPRADLGNRFLASLLDAAVVIGLSLPAIIAFVAATKAVNDYSSTDAPGLYVLTVVFYGLPLTYSLIKDGFWHGQSVGKRAVNLMVVNLDNNTPCSKGKSFFRNFISSLVAVIPFIGWLIEPIMVLATDDGRKLGDKAANTQVIDKDSYF